MASKSYVPMTQGGPSAKSASVYDYVMLFQWNVNNKTPFFVRPLCSIDKNLFPMHYVTGPLKQKSRKSTFKLGYEDPTNYSLFCKIQEGMIIYILKLQTQIKYLINLDTDMDRVRGVLNTINEDYMSMVTAPSSSKWSLSMEIIYDKLIIKYSYRFMAHLSYDWHEKKLRRCFNVPSHTEVIFKII